jgi:AraC family transcriptional regulator
MVDAHLTKTFGGMAVSYYDTVQKAIDFIENHLKEDISLYDISQYVNFSVPHFYRIFKVIVGETVKSYILKRRLSCAAGELRKSNKNISDIAYEYGFESHDVFTRAFCRTYDMPPSKYRNSDIESGFGKLIVDKNYNVVERSIDMNFKVVNNSQITVIGMECNAKQWDADGAIGRLWSAFLGNVDKVKKPVIPNTMYGICECESFDEGDTFTYMAGIEVEESCDAPESMVKRVIKKQKFIQADVPESIKTPDAYNRTFEYAQQNGYIIERSDELEVYEEMFQDPDDHPFKLLIPIK